MNFINLSGSRWFILHPNNKNSHRPICEFMKKKLASPTIGSSQNQPREWDKSWKMVICITRRNNWVSIRPREDAVENWLMYHAPSLGLKSVGESKKICWTFVAPQRMRSPLSIRRIKWKRTFFFTEIIEWSLTHQQHLKDRLRSG